MKMRKTRREIDSAMINELNLSIDNDYNTYQREMLLHKNYERKERRGKFNEALATKGFFNLIVTPYARKYQNEFGTRIGRAEREAVAKSRLRRYRQRQREEHPSFPVKPWW